MQEAGATAGAGRVRPGVIGAVAVRDDLRPDASTRTAPTSGHGCKAGAARTPNERGAIRTAEVIPRLDVALHVREGRGVSLQVLGWSNA